MFRSVIAIVTGMVYKPMEEIISQIQDTVEIVKVIKPIYNFKAGDEPRKKVK